MLIVADIAASGGTPLVLIAGAALLGITAVGFAVAFLWTRRRAAAVQEALDLLDQRFRIIAAGFEETGDAIGICAADGTPIYCNPAFTELFGWATDDELSSAGGPAAAYRDPRVAKKVFERMKSGGSWSGEVEMRDRVGNPLSVFLRADAVRDDDGQVVGLIGVHTDLTDIRASERALRASEERFRRLSESVRDGIVVVDRDGCVTYWNQAAEGVFGYRADEVEGRALMEMLAPARLREEYVARFERFRGEVHGTPAQAAATSHLLAVRKDGREVPVEVSLGTVVLEGDVHFVGVVRDISERERLREQERTLRRDLESKIEELDAFSYSVSHDLKAPLNSLLSYCEHLEEDCADQLKGECGQHLRHIRRSADRMNQIISQLLRLSRVDANTITRMPFRLRDIVGDVRASLGAVLAAEHVHLVLESGDDFVFNAVRGLVEEALVNLVGNGLKFNTSDEPTVAVGLRVLESGEPAIYVRDNGVGLPDDAGERLFRPFQRLHGARWEGSGAGLAITKRIIEAHGGRIWVDSKEGEGTTFTFTLGQMPVDGD